MGRLNVPGSGCADPGIATLRLISPQKAALPLVGDPSMLFIENVACSNQPGGNCSGVAVYFALSAPDGQSSQKEVLQDSLPGQVERYFVIRLLLRRLGFGMNTGGS